MFRILACTLCILLTGAMTIMAQKSSDVTGGIPPGVELPSSIQTMVEQGDYTKAQQDIKKMLEERGESMDMKDQLRLLYEIDRLDRVRQDFNLTKDALLKSVKEEIKDATMEDIERWDTMGFFDYRVIDGQKLYFNRSRSNLYKLSREARQRADKPRSDERDAKFAALMKEIIAAGRTEGKQFVLPRRFNAEMTITVPAGNVPEGELLRCWIPFPHENPLHVDVKVLGTFPEVYHLAPPEQMQRSVYLERPAVKDRDTTFSVHYEFTNYASYIEVDPNKVKPFDVTSDIYKTYTNERPPHLTFSPSLKKLAGEIVGDETNPYLKAKKIYGWVTDNIRYTYAIEYSTIMNISQYCYDNMRGDCGIQALLFINLCRISGVPARWQSGWTTKPGSYNLHDWAQFYIEPYGWLYADPSMCITETDDPEIRWFLFGNIDNLRFVANNDYSMEFDPFKWHFRSEPVDFQRGEVEWRGGNLYYDTWDYHMELKPVE